MARILTGIQSTGTPHLGNILGAIVPAIKLAQNPANEAFYFIADLHSLTQIKDPSQLQENTYGVAAAFLAFGLDTDKNVFYRQSDVPEVTELMWYLNCFTPYPMLANAHSFKEKSGKLSDVNGGLFTYPVLQAADIILYDAHQVPVGKDQLQHLEITRDLATSFNNKMGETFIVPEAFITPDVHVVPGLDGQKMSKSYNNFINIFLPEKQLRKAVMKIITDSKGIEESKDPDSCTVFKLYKLTATEEKVAEMREKYIGGGYGYGEAKQALFEQLRDGYGEQRELFNTYFNDKKMLDSRMKSGASKASKVAQSVLDRVREKLGYLKKH